MIYSLSTKHDTPARSSAQRRLTRIHAHTYTVSKTRAFATSGPHDQAKKIEIKDQGKAQEPDRIFISHAMSSHSSCSNKLQVQYGLLGEGFTSHLSPDLQKKAIHYIF